MALMDKKTKKPGYYYISKDIFDKEYGFSIYAKIVFCYLSRCAGWETTKCFPSIKMIARNCSICYLDALYNIFLIEKLIFHHHIQNHGVRKTTL